MADIDLRNSWLPDRAQTSGTANRAQRYLLDKNTRSLAIVCASDSKLFYGVQSYADNADVSAVVDYLPLTAGVLYNIPVTREKFADADESGAFTFALASASTSVWVTVDPHPVRGD
jgi:hypothetical protein